MRGYLPFKYLGVPICSKRLSIADYECLMDRMMTRIRTWSSKNISFAGRLQLTNFVLLSLHIYWDRVFVLPKSVFKDIWKVCFSMDWQSLQ